LHHWHKAGVTHVWIEVSREMVEMAMLSGVSLNTVIYMGISRDYQDAQYHTETSLKWVKTLIDGLSSDARVLLNGDDRRHAYMVQNTLADVKRYGIKALGHYKARVLHQGFEGMEMDLGERHGWFRITGNANALHLTAIYALLLESGEEHEEVLRVLSLVENIPGSFECLQNASRLWLIIDNVRFEESLKQSFKSLEALRTHNELAVSVIACAPDFDISALLKSALKETDKTILTSSCHHQKTEAVQFEEVMAMVPVSRKRQLMVVDDRSEALKVACHMAKSGDIVYVQTHGGAYPEDINTLTELTR
jgi:UDP-N-acetylmuramoyl-L-alanyl-D-glutamate--2,6-diaminopimelate ligase